MKCLQLAVFFASVVIAGPTRKTPDQAVLGHGPESKYQYLIELGPGDTRWIAEEEKWALKRAGINFMDITDTRDLGELRTLYSRDEPNYPSKVAFKETVLSLSKSLSKKNMRKHLETFTSFYTRYYKSTYGAQSSAWLFDLVSKTVNDSGALEFGSQVKTFKHPWGQHSIIATIPGRTNKTVVIGAHQDSINMFLPLILAAPGADDDGSGTVTILEALRVLLQVEDVIKGNASNTIEFHWYSAEEGGLLGSQAIFSSYAKEGRDITAMLQQDMTGYVHQTLRAGKPESVGIVTDFVNPGLTEFIKEVVTQYCAIPYVLTKCGYACSDHASASKAGYPSAFVIEADRPYWDRNIHTTGDKIDYLSFDHMLQHARLTLGLVYELAFHKFVQKT